MNLRVWVVSGGGAQQQQQQQQQQCFVSGSVAGTSSNHRLQALMSRL
jgi:hypothetical protein